MATVTQPPKPPRYVDFDEFIDFKLRRTENHIRTVDLLTAAAGTAVLVLSYLLLFVVLDHWVVPGGFSYTARLVMLGGVLVAAGVWIVRSIVLPQLRRVNRLYAAKELERADPGFHNTLLGLVDLKRANRPVPEPVKTALEKRAALRLERLDVDRAVDQRRLMRLAYALLAVVALLCLYTLFSPKKISNSIWRALFPTSAVEVATRTEILDVKPGDVEVLVRTPLEISVDLRGEVPDRVVVQYTTEDRRFVDAEVVLHEVEEGLRRYSGVLHGEGGRGLLQNLTYRVVAGDAISRDYQVTVLQPPSAVVERLRYEFPEYMGMEPVSKAGGHIDTWDGTTVTWEARTNMPVSRAVLKFFDSAEAETPSGELRMSISEGTKLSATAPLTMRRDDQANPYPRFYRIECTNEKGQSDPEPAMYTIRLHPDQPPEFELVKPDRDLTLPANATLPITLKVRDPDPFGGIRWVTLRLEKNGQELPRSVSLRDENTPQKVFSTTYELPLAEWSVQNGDVLTYWIEARDNRLPEPNVRKTRRLNIRVVQPADEEQVREELENRRSEQRRQLDESNQQDNPEDQPADADTQGGEGGNQGEAKNDGHEGNDGNQTSPETGEKATDSQSGTDSTAGETPNDGDKTGEGGEEKSRPQFDPNGRDDGDVLRKLREWAERNQPAADQDSPEGQPPEEGTGTKPDSPQPDKTEQPATDPRMRENPADDGSRPDTQPGTEPGTEPGAEPGQNPDKPENATAGSDNKPGTGQPDNPGAAGSETASKTDASEPGAKPSATGNKPDTGDEGTPRKADPDATGQERPTEPSDGDVRRKASGDETGTGTPDNDPNATKAKNPIQRKPGTEPSRKPGDPRAEPDKREPAERANEPGTPKDSPAAKDKPADGEPTKANPAERKSGEPRSAKPKAGEARENGDRPPTGERPKDAPPPTGETGMPSDGEAGGQSPGSGSGKPGAGKQPDGMGKADGPGRASEKSPSTGESPNEGRGEGRGGEKGADGQKGGGSKKGDSAGSTGRANGATGAGQGTQPTGADRPGGAAGGANDREGGFGTGSSPPSGGEEPNLEDARKAADLVLKRLQQQLDRGEVDPQLLEELGWDEEQLKRWSERVQRELQKVGTNGGDESPQEAARRRQFEESLKSILFSARGRRREARSGRTREFEGLGPRRLEPPPEYREATREYFRRFSTLENRPREED